MATQLADGVFWVGVVDWGLRHFHGRELSTHRGSSYNAYLIMDEKIALVDTVWGPFADEFMARLRETVNPARIDYIVVNHAEPDHSGALPALLREASRATVVVSRRGMESVPGHYHADWRPRAVKTGERISLGRNKLAFIEAPFLHWPDSMFTYLTGRGILMPNDAFGQHYAAWSRFNDEVSRDELYEEALKYYANILNPFSPLALKKIEELLALNLPLNMIAPSHGIIWREEPLQIVKAYQAWASQTPEKTAVVLYDTMWQATRRMAEAVGDGLAAGGAPHKLFNVAVSDRNDAIAEVFKARAIIVGSPTQNQGLLPGIAPILAEIKGLKFRNKIGAAFGSYGWSGEGVKLLEQWLGECGIPLAAPGVSIKWQPTAEDLEKCRLMGKRVAEAVKGRGAAANADRDHDQMV